MSSLSRYDTLYQSQIFQSVGITYILYFQQNMDEMEKSHEAFLQGAQMELKKEMALLQKKIMMDTVSIYTQMLFLFCFLAF